MGAGEKVLLSMEKVGRNEKVGGADGTKLADGGCEPDVVGKLES